MDEISAEGRELRKLARKHRGESGYSTWYRQRVGRYAARRRREGAKWSTIACEVGISSTSLSKWMRADLEGSESSAPAEIDMDSEGSWSSEQELLRSLLRRHRSGKEMPKSVRVQLRAYALSRRGEGVTWRNVAAELGVARSSLRRWCEDDSVGTESGGLVPVVIDGPPTVKPTVEAVEGLTLVTPKGFRVEGLQFAHVIQLLGAL